MPVFQWSVFSHLDKSYFFKSLFVIAPSYGHDGWSGWQVTSAPDGMLCCPAGRQCGPVDLSGWGESERTNSNPSSVLQTCGMTLWKSFNYSVALGFFFFFIIHKHGGNNKFSAFRGGLANKSLKRAWQSNALQKSGRLPACKWTGNCIFWEK